MKWVLLLLTATLTKVNSKCTFSDILSNNISCLPSISNDVTYISLPSFQIHLQLYSNEYDDEMSRGVKFALEYYLNYTLSQFDDDADFESGGFGYAVVSDVWIGGGEPVRLLQEVATVWKLSVKGGAFYNLSPGGWIFSSVPTAMELLNRVQSVVEEPLDEGGLKFGRVLEELLAGVDAFREVTGVSLVELETVSPTLRPSDEPTPMPVATAPTDYPTKYPITLAPSSQPTNEPTEYPTRFPITAAPSSRPTTIAPTPNPSTLAPSPNPTYSAIGDVLNSPQPTIGSSATASPSQTDATSPGDIDDSASQTDNYRNTSTEQQQDNIDKALLDQESSTNNSSKIIASVTLVGSFLLLVAVSGAFLIKHHGPKRIEEVKEGKENPLHSLSDEEWNGFKHGELGALAPESNQIKIQNDCFDSMLPSNPSNHQREVPQTPDTELLTEFNKSVVSDSTDKDHRDEEKLTKDEVQKELFLTPEKEANVGPPENDVESDEFIIVRKSQHSSALGDMPHNNDVESSPLSAYSPSNETPTHTPQPSTSKLSFVKPNIISPMSLQPRRHSFSPPRYHPDPPENDASVATDNDSLLPSINDDASSGSFPEVNSSWNEVSSDVGTNKNVFKRCIVDCSPLSFKQLLLPKRHEEDEFDEGNDLVARNENWFDNALCGRDYGEKGMRGIDPQETSAELSDGPPEYENDDWDFDDVENDDNEDDSIDYFVVPKFKDPF